MANKLSLVTSGDKWILELDSVPNTGAGFDAPIGSTATVDGLSSNWVKFGALATDWRDFSDETFSNILTDFITVNKDLIVANLVLPATSTVSTLNGTKTLINTDKTAQLITGSATGFSIVLPDATTIPQGHKYEFYNASSVPITVKSADGVALFSLSQFSTGYLYLQASGSIAGTWLAWQIMSNPNIASGILNYIVASSTTFTTSSATDVIITGFTVTPQAGTYAVWYNAAVSITTNNTLLRSSIYKNGVLVTDSTRIAQAAGGGWQGAASTLSTIQFNGTDTCDIRVRSSSGSISVVARTMLLIRLGN